MFPTIEYASTCRFCETYVSEYVLVVSALKLDVKLLMHFKMSSDDDHVAVPAQLAKRPRQVDGVLDFFRN
jgi:hypothetical protein